MHAVQNLDNDILDLESIIATAEEFRKLEFAAKQTILDPWLTEQQIIWVSGWRGIGKTFFALSLLHNITTGESFGPWDVKNPLNCLYLDGEMVQTDIQDRLNAFDREGADVIKRKAELYLYSDAFASQIPNSRPANLRDPIWCDAIKEFMLEHHIKLWVVDNLGALSGGVDENTKKDFDPINKFLLELRYAGIGTIVLHHTGKGGDQRGTSAHEDNVDISIILKHPADYSGEDGARFEVQFKKNRISLHDTAKVHNIEFKLTEQDDCLSWTWRNIKQESKVEILRLVNDGLKPKEISSTLNITDNTVYIAMSRLRKDGLIGKRGKLTPDGMKYIDEN